MQPIRWRLLAAASLLLLARSSAARPVYGGILRVSTRAASMEPAHNFLLRGLVYENLTRFAEAGEVAPELALAWQEENGARRWRFDLRPGVRFHDGSALDPHTVVAILQPLNSAWRWSVEGSSVVVTADRPAPQLPAELTQAVYAVRRQGADGLPIATGPFRVSRLDSGRLATLEANRGHWRGAPFLDGIELTLNRTTREQAIDFELRRTDLVELNPAEMRRATQAGRTVTGSLPKQLIALRFTDSADPATRRALAWSIDRGSMHSVLLQRHGESTAALLPQWLTGYAFVFPTAPEAEKARREAASVRAAPLTIYADPEDTVLKNVADRIAVNARDVGLAVRVVTSLSKAAEARLQRIAIDTTSGGLALAQVAAALGLPAPAVETDPQALYAAESRLLETGLVVPLFHLPQAWLWSPRIRVWLSPPEGKDGSLNLANAWILEERTRP